MSKEPQVSIVIPAYNAERFLSSTIESALGQTFEALEVIVVDDASTDNTVGIAQKFARKDMRVRVLPLSQNGRVAVARNKGISALHPTSSAALFLDHDDILESDAIEQLWAVLKRYPTCAAAYGLPRYIDASGQVIWQGEGEKYSRERYRLTKGGVELCKIEDPTTFDVLVVCCCIYTPGLGLIRREAIDRVGEFDARMMYCADWDYWLRLSFEGELRMLDRVVLNYRLHDSMSTMFTGTKDEALLLRKIEESPALTKEQRKMMRQGRRWYCWIASVDWFQRAKQMAREGHYLRAINRLRRGMRDLLRFYWRGLGVLGD